MRYTYVLFTITQMLLAFLRSMEVVKIAFYTSVSTLIINVGINYTLIFGRFGLPEMGITGAAIGTISARVIELGIIIAFVVRRVKKMNVGFGAFKPARVLFSKYMKAGTPVMVTRALWGVSGPVQTSILGHLSSEAIAANSAASTLYQYMKMFSVGCCSAAAVTIGKTVGSGDLKKIKEYSRTLQILFVSVGCILCLLLNLLRKPVLSLYTLTPEAAVLADKFLIILSVIIIGMSYVMPTLNGIIQSGGDTSFAMKVNLVSIWVIVIPLSYLGAFVWHWHPLAVFAMLNADQVFKALPAAIKANRYKWVRRLTSDIDRG